MKYDKDKFAEEINKQLRADCERLIKQRNINIENWLKEQIADVFEQLIKSGDIVRYVDQAKDKHSVVYIPYRRAQELELEVKELKALLATYIK